MRLVAAMGFFEGLIDLAGATAIDATFRDKSWTGDARTLLAVRWTES